MDRTVLKGFLFLLFSLLFLSSCGNSNSESITIREGFSPEMFSYGEDAIEITQSYIDGKTNRNKAYQQLVEIEEKSSSLIESEQAEKYDEHISFFISKMREDIGKDNITEIVPFLEAFNKTMYDPEVNLEPTFTDQLVGGWKYKYNNGWEGYWVFNADGTGNAKVYDGFKLLNEFDFSYSVDEENQTIHRVGKDGTIYTDPWITITDFTGDSFYSELNTNERTDPEANDGMCTRVEQKY